MSKILEEGPIRRILKERKTIFFESPLVSKFDFQGVRGINSGLEDVIEAKRVEWRGRGATEHQITMAVQMATEWAHSMAKAFAPPEVLEAAVRKNLPKGLDVADRWLRAFGVQ